MLYNVATLQQEKDSLDISIELGKQDKIVAREIPSGSLIVKSYQGSGISWKGIQELMEHLKVERQTIQNCCCQWCNPVEVFISEIELCNGESYTEKKDWPFTFGVPFLFHDGELKIDTTDCHTEYFTLPCHILLQLFAVAREFVSRFPSAVDTSPHYYTKWHRRENDVPCVGESLENFLNRIIGSDVMARISYYSYIGHLQKQQEKFFPSYFLLESASLTIKGSEIAVLQIIGIQDEWKEYFTMDDNCDWFIHPNSNSVDLYLRCRFHLQQLKRQPNEWRHPHIEIVASDEESFILHRSFNVKPDGEPIEEWDSFFNSVPNTFLRFLEGK